MRNAALVTVLCLSAATSLAVASSPSASSAGGSSHPAAAHMGSSAHISGGATARNGATARSIIGESASGFVVSKQTVLEHSISVTSFKTPRPLTGPERRRLNHEGFIATKSNDAIYYCRKALDAMRDTECFGPEVAR